MNKLKIQEVFIKIGGPQIHKGNTLGAAMGRTQYEKEKEKGKK